MRQYKTENYIEKGLSLGLFLEEHSSGCDEHTHEFAEIVYAISGEALETVNGTEHKVERGDLLFINYGSTHKVVPVSNYSYINICFSPEIIGNRIITRENAFDLLSLTALEELRREYGADFVSFVGEERRLIETLLLDMLREYNSSLDERTAVLESYMTVLIAKILRKKKLKTAAGEREIWRELSGYIEENLDKDLSLSALAQKCFYNPSYFSRAFKEKFGTTLIDHIMKERTAAAAKMLAESEFSIDGIAEKCGFGDRTALYRAFIKFYGTPPAEYRKQSKK